MASAFSLLLPGLSSQMLVNNPDLTTRTDTQPTFGSQELKLKGHGRCWPVFSFQIIDLGLGRAGFPFVTGRSHGNGVGDLGVEAQLSNFLAL